MRPSWPRELGEPGVRAREHFLDAVQAEAPTAYGELKASAEDILPRFNDEMLWRAWAPVGGGWRLAEEIRRLLYEDEEPRHHWAAVAWAWRTFAASHEEILERFADDERPWRIWARVARVWRRKWRLNDRENRWVADWLLYRLIVGTRTPGCMDAASFEHHLEARRRYFFLVPPRQSHWLNASPSRTPSEPWFNRPWLHYPVEGIPQSHGVLVSFETFLRDFPFRSWDHAIETWPAWCAGLDVVLDEYRKAVLHEAKAKGSELQPVRIKRTLQRDLRRLVRFQLLEQSYTELGKGGEDQSATTKALREVGELIGLKRRRNSRGGT